MDDAGVGDGDRQAYPIMHDFPVQINRHVLAERALVVQHIRSCPRIPGEHGIQGLPDRAAGDVRIWARDVSLDVGGEGDPGHGYNGIANSVSIFSLSSTTIRSRNRYSLLETSILSRYRPVANSIVVPSVMIRATMKCD